MFRRYFEPDEPAGGVTPPVGDPPGDPAATAGDPPAGDPPGEPDDSNEMVPRSALAKANREAAANRREASELKAKLQAIDQEKLTDQERATQRAEAAEAQASSATSKLQRANLRAEVAEHAARLGFNDSSDALAHVLLHEVEFDDDHQPQDIGSALAELARSKPYLVGRTSDDPEPKPTGRAGGALSAPGGGGRQPLTSKQLNAMTRDEVAALSDDEFAAAAAR